MSDALWLAFGVGLNAGLLISHLLWKAKIREKALTGFRLECGGKLYNVTEAK